MKTTKREHDAGYHADHLTHLKGLDAVRKRPGMYIGSTTDSSGLTHLVFEIMDNAVDEAIAGHCSLITISLSNDGQVTVTDNGRGIPTGLHRDSGKSGVELVFTELHAGGKFSSSGGYQGVAGGLHGVGASVVNALSERVDVQVRQSGWLHEMSFQRGTPGSYSSRRRNASFTPSEGLRRVRKLKRSEGTGTTVTFRPDRSIFPENVHVSTEAVLERAQQTAFLVPGLKIVVTSDNGTTSFTSRGGTTDMVKHLTATNESVSGVVPLRGSGVFTETVPIVDTDAGLRSQNVERTVEVDIALCWSPGSATTTKSFVNVVATPSHGTHVKGFEKALLSAVRQGYEGTRLLKTGEELPVLSDIAEGLTAVVSVRLPEPQFRGQTKEELGTAGVTKVVSTVVADSLGAWFASRNKRSRAVLAKIADSSRARIAARQQRDIVKRKSALKSSAMPAKLVDCRSPGVPGSELFLVEGDSALGSCRSARNAEFQALLPLRGKILNVHRANAAEMLKNAECAAIAQVLGAGIGAAFETSKVRYDRVLLMTDADVDGSHIRVLLITLFYTYFQDLITQGRLYVAVPPLHRVETVGTPKGQKAVFTYTQEQMEEVVAQFRQEGQTVRTPIQRFKGLGEMGASELWDTAMNPATRTVRRVTMADAEKAATVLGLVMGADVEPRRRWLVENANRVNLEELT